MSYQTIHAYLIDNGFDVKLTGKLDPKFMEINFSIREKTVTLTHICQSEIKKLPAFCLKDYKQYGRLGHVTPFKDQNSIYASVCIADKDSLSVNYDNPNLAFEESINRHIDLLTRLITDPEWNRQEILREFYANWSTLCTNDSPELVCAVKKEFEELDILGPVKGSFIGINSKYIGLSESLADLDDYNYLVNQKTKDRTSAGIGFNIPLDHVTPAPYPNEGLADWYLDNINQIDLPDYMVHKRNNIFWLIFNADTPSGRNWWGLKLHYKKNAKKTLPKKVEQLENWSIEPVHVQIFSKERIMPRGGADLNLDKKSVLLVGCGSVGGEIATKIAAAGVGQLGLVDIDTYTIDNLYRHVLPDYLLGCPKSLAMKYFLSEKFPWTKIKEEAIDLLGIREKGLIESYDVMIIAIGAPTTERLFHDFLTKEKIKTPVIFTWLEGYGIGGHAILDIPGSPGCLQCAYYDNVEQSRGLSPNINFLEPNQDVSINYAGCGEAFIPYNASSAAQTAIIATNLAIDYLLGNRQSSTKVSWKGDSRLAEKQNLEITHHYTQFNQSLMYLALHNRYCDLCNDSE